MARAKVRSDNRVVYGRITYCDSGRPAVGVRVTAMDADLLFDDRLGEDQTKDNGQFRIGYGVAQFRDLFERAPDIYLLVHDESGRLITTTRDSVVRDAGPEQEIHVLLPGGKRQRPTKTVPLAGTQVDKRAFDALEPDDVFAIAESLVASKPDERAIRILDALNPTLADDLVQPKLCTTPITRVVYDIVRIKKLDREVLLRIEEILTGYDTSKGFTLYACLPFDINYETTGDTQVDTTDSETDIVIPGTATKVGTTLANGIPNYIERVCFWLQTALSVYTSPPFSLTPPLGGGTITVNVNNAAYGNASGGTINIQHDLSDDLLAWVLVHELMHLIQEEYTTNGTAGGWYWGIVEGGAVFAEDTVLDPINRYAAEAAGWGGEGTLLAPENSLKTQSYKLSFFFKYISEQQSPRVNPVDEPLIGVETYRELLEKFDAQGYNTAAFEDAIRDLPWYQHFFKFGYLDAAQFDLTRSETVLGNFWLACYLKDFGVNIPDRRFDFMEDEQVSLADDIEPIGVPAGSIGTMVSVDLQSDVNLNSGGTVTLSSGGGGSVSDFAARLYKVTPAADVDTFRVNFTAGAGFTRPLVQVVLVESGNVVRDILRSDRTTWDRTIANDRSGTNLDHILIVVAGTDVGGTFTLSVQDVAPAPDVMVTRWHSAIGTNYEIDSFNWAWTWSSPDIWVDNNMDNVADDEVFFNQNNKLFVRLHNQGNADANDIEVEFWYQDATGGLNDADWLPVQNTASVTQTLTGLALAAQSSNQWSVDWAPVPSGTSKHFCVRAIVTVPGDPNIDNKRCLNNFGNVIVGSGFLDLILLRPVVHARQDVKTLVIPRTNGRYLVSKVDIARTNATPLRIGSDVVDVLRVRRMNIEKRIQQDHEEPLDCAELLKRRLNVARPGQTRLERMPDPHGHYPTNPRALPPGMEDADLITVAHVVDGEVVGGFTWAIGEKDGG